jgi:hypothetical protein
MNPRFRRLNISSRYFVRFHEARNRLEAEFKLLRHSVLRVASRLYLKAETYRKNTEEDAFEAAFAGFQTQPTASRTYAPSKPLTPWYLDSTSGGPNPEVKKAGISYEEN